MIQRIIKLVPLPDYQLAAAFDDGRKVIYDVKDDMKLPGYQLLAEVPGLFQQVQLDESRTCVFWSDEIDLPSHAVYEYGRPVEELPDRWDPDYTGLTPEEVRRVNQAASEIAAGDYVRDSAISWD